MASNLNPGLPYCWPRNSFFSAFLPHLPLRTKKITHYFFISNRSLLPETPLLPPSLDSIFHHAQSLLHRLSPQPLVTEHLTPILITSWPISSKATQISWRLNLDLKPGEWVQQKFWNSKTKPDIAAKVKTCVAAMRVYVATWRSGGKWWWKSQGKDDLVPNPLQI